MPMGIVNDEDFQKELEDSHTPVRIPEIVNPPADGARIENIPLPGRKEGDVNVPDSLRKLIGETAELEGRQDALALAACFDISPSSVSAYKNGARSTASMDKTPNKGHILSAKEKVSKRARKKLLLAISHITDAKLQNCDAPELGQVARSMSAVVKDMEPKEEQRTDKDKPQFVFYSPTLHQETHYDVIAARE